MTFPIRESVADRIRASPCAAPSLKQEKRHVRKIDRVVVEFFVCWLNSWILI